MNITDIIGMVLIGDGIISMATSDPGETYREGKQLGRLLRMGIGGYLIWTNF